MSSIKILYVEDDLEVRENYTFILEDYFGNVTSIGTGKEALNLYEEQSFDLLILDINLPDMSGLEIAETIRKKDLDTKIIMLTAYSDRERLLQAVSLKLDSYLIKPIDVKTFIKTISELSLEIKSQEEQDLSKIAISQNLYWDTTVSSLIFEENPIKLTKKEILLMQVMAKNINSYIDKDSLILKIWEDEIPDHTYNQKLTQLVYRLNKKFVEKTLIDKNLILNNYSVGYKLESF